MAKKKSWVSLVKRFFLLETPSKPEKVDSLGLEYVCGKSSSITQLISSTRFILFFYIFCRGARGEDGCLQGCSEQKV